MPIGQMVEYIDKYQCFDLLSDESKIQIVDLRDIEDFKNGHIPEAIHLDILKNGSYNRLKALNIHVPHLFYCNTGLRTNSLVRILEGMGFEQVYILRDGLKDWEWLLENE